MVNKVQMKTERLKHPEDEPTEDELRSRIRNSALGSLTRREHARAELAAKLQSRFDSPALIAETLDWLASLNYLDDARFAEAFVRAGVLKGRGPQRIRRELQQKGVDPDIAERALVESEVDWLAQARELHERKFGRPPADAKSRARQMRFLLYRGFSMEVANSIMKAQPDDSD